LPEGWTSTLANTPLVNTDRRRERDQFRLALHIYNDKTATTVGEWPRDLHFAGAVPRAQILEMSRAPWSQRSASGPSWPIITNSIASSL